MNKAELIDHVATTTGSGKKDAEEAVEAVLGGIMTTIRKGEEVQLFGFGKFSPKTNAARIGRNPRTNEALKIAASKGVRFGPAQAFKTALNTKSAKKAGAKKAAPSKKAAAPAKKAAAPAKKTAAPARKAAAPAKKTAAAKKR